jgi:hypothetical protein
VRNEITSTLSLEEGKNAIANGEYRLANRLLKEVSTKQMHRKRSPQAVLLALAFGVSIAEVSTIFSWTPVCLSV